MLNLVVPKRHKAEQDNPLRVLLLHHRLHLQEGLVATVLPAHLLAVTAAVAAVPDRPNHVKRKWVTPFITKKEEKMEDPDGNASGKRRRNGVGSHRNDGRTQACVRESDDLKINRSSRLYLHLLE